MNKPSILDTIIQHKREEVKSLYALRSEFTGGRSDTKRSFAAALDKKPELAIIAEVKKASPSKGLICAEFDPVAIAGRYELGGADAVSVITDKKFFMGDTEYLGLVRRAVVLPVLRKDFIIDPVQVEQTACLNADAMLLIAAVLSDMQLKELYDTAIQKGIEPLVEIHNSAELDRVMKISPAIIGINNRDLTTFELSLDTTMSLLPYIPENVTVVSESGIFTGKEAMLLKKAGVSAVLVGESLMRAKNAGELIGELRSGLSG
jgi:indole-3-glycerol phosphate synthase